MRTSRGARFSAFALAASRISAFRASFSELTYLYCQHY